QYALHGLCAVLCRSEVAAAVISGVPSVLFGKVISFTSCPAALPKAASPVLGPTARPVQLLGFNILCSSLSSLVPIPAWILQEHPDEEEKFLVSNPQTELVGVGKHFKGPAAQVDSTREYTAYEN
ncbi:hypothetical protein EK904_001171, partial [Melospiza melodia maxima]